MDYTAAYWVMCHTLGITGVGVQETRPNAAVSELAAKEMALGCKKITNSDIAVSITGVAGPDGGTLSKPVGMVCFSIVNDSKVRTYTHHLKGDREHIRQEACKIALQMILDLLQI